MAFYNELLDERYRFLELLDNGFIEIVNPDGTRDHAYHLVIKGVNKVSAARIIQEKLGCDRSTTIGAGDSLSDLSLVHACRKFILVRNPAVEPSQVLERFRRDLVARSDKESVEELMVRISVSRDYGSQGWSQALQAELIED